MSSKDNASSNGSSAGNNAKLEISKASVEEIIDLRHYFAVINKYKWRIGFFAIAVSLLPLYIAQPRPF